MTSPATSIFPSSQALWTTRLTACSGAGIATIATRGCPPSRERVVRVACPHVFLPCDRFEHWWASRQCHPAVMRRSCLNATCDGPGPRGGLGIPKGSREPALQFRHPLVHSITRVSGLERDGKARGQGFRPDPPRRTHPPTVGTQENRFRAAHTTAILFTSESVSMGHPDKMADQISDGILDAILEQDPYARVACESLLTTGLVCLAGEITTKAMVDYPTIVRQIVREIGYTSSEMGFDATTCAVLVALGKQSPDIAMGVDEDTARGKDIGAGDQGMMFGYACNETPELMPLPIALAHRIINRITELRQDGTIPWLRPDAKSQVTIEYDGQTPVRVNTVVVSTQHAPRRHARDDPRADQERGHPAGPAAEHGRRRDHLPHQPDRQVRRRRAARRLGGDRPQDHRRHLRRPGPPRRRRLQRQGPHEGRPLGRLHGPLRRQERRRLRAWPTAARSSSPTPSASRSRSASTSTPRGPARSPTREIAELVRKTFPLTPSGIIRHLDLRRPIYRKTASGGHFGRSRARVHLGADRQGRGAPSGRDAPARWPDPDPIARGRPGRHAPPRPHHVLAASLWSRDALAPISSPSVRVIRRCPQRRKGRARAAFVASFGAAPGVLSRAPGRVELLGNHTDYNGGLVLAAAIDRLTVVAGRAVSGARRGSGR